MYQMQPPKINDKDNRFQASDWA